MLAPAFANSTQPRRGKGQRRKFRLRAEAQQQSAERLTQTDSEGETESRTGTEIHSGGISSASDGKEAINLRLRARGLDKRVTRMPGNTHVLPLQSILVLRLSQRAAFYSAYHVCAENLHALAVSSVANRRDTHPSFDKAVLKRVPLDIDAVLWKHEGKIVREEIWKNKTGVTVARAKRLHDRARRYRETTEHAEEEDVLELSDTERPLIIRRFGDRPGAAAAAAASTGTARQLSTEKKIGAAFASPTAYVKAVFESIILALAVDANSWYYHAMRMIAGYFLPNTKQVVDPDPVGAVRWTNRKLRGLLLDTEDLPGAIDLLCARTDVFPTVLVHARRFEASNAAAADVFSQLCALPTFDACGATRPDLIIVHNEHGKIVHVHINDAWLEPGEEEAMQHSPAVAAEPDELQEEA